MTKVHHRATTKKPRREPGLLWQIKTPTSASGTSRLHPCDPVFGGLLQLAFELLTALGHLVVARQIPAASPQEANQNLNSMFDPERCRHIHARILLGM
jgi:hypothetical protein